VSYILLRDAREINRNYNKTDKSEKQRIKVTEMRNCTLSKGLKNLINVITINPHLVVWLSNPALCYRARTRLNWRLLCKGGHSFFLNYNYSHPEYPDSGVTGV
jgi:hypothetical protein